MGDVKQRDIRELMGFGLTYDEARDRLLLMKALKRFPRAYRSAETRALHRDDAMEYLIRWAKSKLRRSVKGTASSSRSSGKKARRGAQEVSHGLLSIRARHR
jgi:hypothetical protein